MSNIPKPLHPETLAVRAGKITTAEQEHSDALFLSSSFLYDDAASAEQLFRQSGRENIYSRFSNPTVRAFEERLAALEQGEHCVATASGMGAMTLLAMTVLSAGDHVVVSQNTFSHTGKIFQQIMGKFGVQSTSVAVDDIQAWTSAMQGNTKLLMVESPTNPGIQVADIRALSRIAQQNQALLAVDNCFCSPALQQPISLGADIVVHSATKFIDGQGRAIGGAVVTNAALGEALYKMQRSLGITMGAFDAWIFQKGLETLPVRMAKHCENAQKLAEWLDAHAAIERVNYLGLPSHPQHELAKSQQTGFGGVLSFEVDGGQAAAWRVIDSVEILSKTGNLGDVRTTITHPATTTHGSLSDTERQAAGIGEGLIRVSVGLEHIDDIIADIARGLE